MLELNKIHLGDCLERMKEIPDKTVDMILCDLPQAFTARNKWDVIIPFEPMWNQYNRIIKDNGAIILFANGIFTADLMISNRKMWRYNLVWDKVLASGHLNAKRMPMRQHEDICVFYKKPPLYNPQKKKGKPSHSIGSAAGKSSDEMYDNTNYGEYNRVQSISDMKYPKSILIFQKPHPSTTIHSTQKPVELYEFLIRTYTNQGATILDNCSGSGTAAVASINSGRIFICIEKDIKEYEKSCRRIADHINSRMTEVIK